VIRNGEMEPKKKGQPQGRLAFVHPFRRSFKPESEPDHVQALAL